jgi:hypothetical protein
LKSRDKSGSKRRTSLKPLFFQYHFPHPTIQANLVPSTPVKITRLSFSAYCRNAMRRVSLSLRLSSSHIWSTMNLFFPLDTWTLAFVFMVQPERVPLYFGYFILGIYAYTPLILEIALGTLNSNLSIHYCPYSPYDSNL